MPIPFADLVRRMRSELEASEAIFDLPVRKWFHPEAGPDLGVVHAGRRAATPVGPAAGPHTQLAQNLVLAWLAGARILELKTVQVDDRLEIPRPCIHAPNVGLNVEWSQELRVEESAREYAKAAYLIAILRTTRAFGVLHDAASAQFDTVFDISVGYDLEGIRSAQVTRFLDTLRAPERLYDELRSQLDGELTPYRDLVPPAPVADAVTLSTFHGCPAEQIEAIASYLLEERGLSTIVKLNPTLLGFEQVEHLLHERLGYRQFALRREAFDKDLQYDDALAILHRLRAVAARCGSTIGAKFTNTLVVENAPDIFPTQTDPYMYLSGPPLHVIAMTLMQRVREDAGFAFPVSFSAGIDATNFPAAVACGMVPVTTCTDLLRQGGYGRLPAYLRTLGRAMTQLGVTTREAYVLAAGGHGEAAAEEALGQGEAGKAVWGSAHGAIASVARERPDELPSVLRALATTHGLDPERLVSAVVAVAGRRNGRAIVDALSDDPRYHARANAKGPRRLERTLARYDCINCDLCIPACPNDAMFAYQVSPVEVPTERVRAGPAGLRREPGAGFAIRDAHQLAVYEGACNACSNCEVYCPERGAPFIVKERVFGSRADFERCADLDGFCREDGVLHARVDGAVWRADLSPETGHATIVGPGLRLDVAWPGLDVLSGEADPDAAVDTALLWRMRTAWESIFASRVPNVVNPAGIS